jgi:hypothetical protein
MCHRLLPTYSVWGWDLNLAISKNRNNRQRVSKVGNLLREREKNRAPTAVPQLGRGSQERIATSWSLSSGLYCVRKKVQTKTQPGLPSWTNQASACFAYMCFALSWLWSYIRQWLGLTQGFGPWFSRWESSHVCHIVSVAISFSQKPWESACLLLSHWDLGCLPVCCECWFIFRGHSLTTSTFSTS